MMMERVGTAFGVRPRGPKLVDGYGTRIAVTAAFRADWTPARQKEAVLMLAELGLPPLGIAAHLGLDREAVATLAAGEVRREAAATGDPETGDQAIGVLTEVRLRCLALVAAAGGAGTAGARLSKREVAGLLVISVGGAGRALAALSAGGFVLVETVPSVGSVYRLTDKGRRALTEAEL